MPAPTGNRNRTTHGRRGFLALGTLPKGAAYIRRCIGQLRAECEAAVIEAKGQLNLTDAATCQSVARHEGRALLAVRWLRQRGSEMSDSERLGYLRELGNATDARDRAIRSLRLDVAATDPWTALTDVTAPDDAEPDNPATWPGEASP